MSYILENIINTVICDDCLNVMRQLPDKCIDLVLTDPPYGIGNTWSKSRSDRFYNNKNAYNNNEIPSIDYFDEFFRISKNQIIFGANYYKNLWPSNHLIIWDKGRDVEKTYMSEAEIAWHSFKTPTEIYFHEWDGARKGPERGLKKIHPSQKPIGLFRWCLQKYAKPGQIIFDPYAGSASSIIACLEENYNYIAVEKEKIFFNEINKRITLWRDQGRMFA